jgi:uncharacterized Zn-finger protein
LPESLNPLMCLICGEVTQSTEDFKVHLTKHPSSQLYRCALCYKEFHEESVFIRHMETHLEQDERPFKCSSCDKRFGKKEHLQRHFLVHTGEKPFRCAICQKCFARKDTLKSHTIVHLQKWCTVFQWM